MTRDYTIDFLRTIGTLSVIMAHVNPPNWLFQIRSFDVILLVTLSGMSFGRSNKLPYSQYLIKRCKRLLKPTYICITILFTLCFVTCIITNREQLYSIEDMVYSYILSDHGMGYIWIVKVYLLIAIFLPLLEKIDNAVCNDWLLICVVISLLVVQNYFLHLYCFENCIWFSDYLAYIIPYSIVAMIGLKWRGMNYMIKIVLFIISSLATCVYAINYGFIPNSYKFPPDVFYVVYGLSASIAMIHFTDKFSPMLEVIDKKGVCTFLSKNSFTLYLCHIIIMLSYNMIAKTTKIGLLDNFIIHYFFVVLFSLSITILISKIQLINK